MPLMSFSIPEQIPLLLDGRKQQTTRFKRKNPINVGDILYCYYKPRMRPSCKNCIVFPCTLQLQKDSMSPGLKIVDCSDWNNYFGEAEVIHVRNFELYKYILEKWAVADGFENIDRAMDWIENTHPNWEKHMQDFVVISFAPKWLK